MVLLANENYNKNKTVKKIRYLWKNITKIFDIVNETDYIMNLLNAKTFM